MFSLSHQSCFLPFLDLNFCFVFNLYFSIMFKIEIVSVDSLLLCCIIFSVLGMEPRTSCNVKASALSLLYSLPCYLLFECIVYMLVFVMVHVCLYM